MAKLGSYYGLCPIIDQKSLLGINQDAQSGQVLVTLGKNIAIKYKLSDQKQLISWRAKDKFTSPIIYYPEDEKYCAVFNQMFLKLWSNDDEHLDKIKRLKFNKPIHTLVGCANHTFLVFQNGTMISLTKALEDRKHLDPVDIIKKDETILDVFVTIHNEKVFGGLLVQNSEKHKYLVYNLLDSENEQICRIYLKKDDSVLSGCVVTVNNMQEFVLLTLWSDGKLFSYSLNGKSEETFLTILDSISCKEPVTMHALSGDYLAMYGADNSQEGALLIIYNIQFKVTQCKQPFKLYTSGTKLWCLESNLFLCVGQNLAVVPHKLSVEHLAALVGSHKVKTNDPDIAIVQELIATQWDEARKCKKKKTAYNEHVDELLQQGWPEAAIIEDVLPKHMEENDLKSIENCLDYFQDIPEHYCVKLLNYILSLQSKHFKSQTTNGKLPDSLTPLERCHLLDKILMKPHSSIVLMPQLRAHLPINNALLLLRYICYLLSEDGHILGVNVPQDERKLIDWGSVLLDANYQKFMLTKDQKIVEVLSYFNELVKANLCCLDQVQDLAPVVTRLHSGKYQKNNALLHNTMYSVENIKLY